MVQVKRETNKRKGDKSDFIKINRLNRLFPYELSPNIFRLLPRQPCSLKTLINIFRYQNNFCKPEKVVVPLVQSQALI